MAVDFKKFLAGEGIDTVGALPLARSKLLRPDKLARLGTGEGGSVLLLLLPYLVRGERRNISAYAVPRDYHGYFRWLCDRLCPLLAAQFPGRRFSGASDNSPVDEVHAAVRAGLGFFGDNGLFICEKYGSYVFIGGVYSDLPAEEYGLPSGGVERFCAHCGACAAACPTGAVGGGKGDCLSALTQKKGELTREECRLLRGQGSAWGCDLCQQVCPYNRAAAETAIPFFREARTPRLTHAAVAAMSEEEFADRAYAWRGRQTILRNLKLLEEEDD